MWFKRISGSYVPTSVYSLGWNYNFLHLIKMKEYNLLQNYFHLFIISLFNRITNTLKFLDND